jgi:hypothetical protein
VGVDGADVANDSGPEVTSPIAGTMTAGGVVRISTGSSMSSSISVIDDAGGLGGRGTACGSLGGGDGTNVSMGSKGLTATTGSSEIGAGVSDSVCAWTSSVVDSGAGVTGTIPVSTTESHERVGSFERAPSGGTMQIHRHATGRA